jgi:hypothetical protein
MDVLSYTTVEDDYGHLHLFWIESDVDANRTLVQYRLLDGTGWTQPIDIFVFPYLINLASIRAILDKTGMIHLFWQPGQYSPVYHSYSIDLDPASAKSWSEPQSIGFDDALNYAIEFSPDGTYHIAFTKYGGQEQGVFYAYSLDQGETWSEPNWIDPDFPNGFYPFMLNFEKDNEGGLHLAWSYNLPKEQGTPGRWLRYAHSQDGGKTWKTPITIVGRKDSLNTITGAMMSVSGKNIILVWADNPFYRYYAYSSNLGNTWSTSEQIFGDLLGQAGDGCTVDVLDQVHFVGQIRYPMGIYHAIWEQYRWSAPKLVYLIQESPASPYKGRIRAHNVKLRFRAGNQMIIFFTNEPIEPTLVLYEIHCLADDLPYLTPKAVPTVTATLPPATTTMQKIEETPTQQFQFSDGSNQSSEANGAFDNSGILLIGILPVVFLIVVVIMSRSVIHKPK